MNSTTILTGLGVATATTSATVDENGDINKTKRNNVIGTTVAVTATSVIGNTLNAAGMSRIYNQYAQAYVESMSEEELAEACEKLGLIEEDSKADTDVKTL